MALKKKYRDNYVTSPSSKHKLVKKKEHSKKKDSSKIMRSGSVSAMFHSSVQESSKKSLPRKKSGLLKTIPYSVSQNMLGSTMATSSPTIAMFNSIINSQKTLKHKKSSSKKKRDMATPSTNSKFRNTFLSQYDMNSPSTHSLSKCQEKNMTTSASIKNALSSNRAGSQLQDINN